MTGDALSDVLKTVRLTGAAYFDVAASAPWVAEQPARELVLPKILPGASHLISYHVLVEGECFAGVVGETPVAVRAGEVVVFTRGDPHVLSSSPGMRADPLPPETIAAIAAGPLPFYASYGNGAAVTARLVCGFLACDAHPFNPLLDNLPPVIVAGEPAKGDANWLARFIRVATFETASKRAGAESVLAKLSELMFIEALRRHLEALPPAQSGWLAGLRDPFIGKALAALHRDAARPWTLEQLAREVGLSRSVLAQRFADVVGMPPMQYLARWRMQVAAGLLNCGRASMAEVAAAVGYGSEAAFSRAFKHVVGTPPSAWRGR